MGIKGDQVENKGDRDAPRSRAHVDETAVDLLQRAASMAERRTPAIKRDQRRSREIGGDSTERRTPGESLVYFPPTPARSW